MILKTYEERGATVAGITVKEANLTNANELKAELIVLIDRGSKNILIDFGNVQYVDSSFLGALVSSLKHAVACRADISVFNLAKDIKDLFALIRLDKVFKVYEGKNEAIAAITNR